MHWARVTMYEHAADLFRSSARGLAVLEISGEAFKGLCAWGHYESRTTIDLCNEAAPHLGRGGFDLVVLDQVLEHVREPSAAVRVASSFLRPGGQLFVSTPFMVRPHPAPIDLWRWTPLGLRFLLEGEGLDVLGSRSWGNPACVLANLYHWADYDPRECSLDNDPACPVTCWAWARRPEAGRPGDDPVRIASAPDAAPEPPDAA